MSAPSSAPISLVIPAASASPRASKPPSASSRDAETGAGANQSFTAILHQFAKPLGQTVGAKPAGNQGVSQEPRLDTTQSMQGIATDPTILAAAVAAMTAAAVVVTGVSDDSAAHQATPAVPAELTNPANTDLAVLSGQVLTASAIARSPNARTLETKSTESSPEKHSLAFDLSNSAASDGPSDNASIVAVNSDGKASTGKPANTLPVIETSESSNRAAIVAAPALTSAALAAQNTANANGSASFESILGHAQGGNAVSAEAMAAGLASASAHAENTTRLAAAASNVTPALVVNTPLGNAGWTTDIGDKVMWMVGRQEQHVELVLNPPQLGRVEVSLSLNGDQATAQFLSTNPVVREALESAMPRLREMLADSGITLGQTHVGSDSSGQAANQRENGDNRLRFGSGAMLGSPMEVVGAAPRWFERGRGLVDTFA